MSMPPGMGPPGGPGGGQSPFDPGEAFLSLPQHLLTPQYILASASPQQEPPPRDPPTLEEIIALSNRLTAYWQPLHDRMDEDEKLYRLIFEAEGEGESVIRNTPFVAVEKISNMLGSQKPQQDLIRPHDALKKQSQRVEDGIRWMWDEWSREWSQALHGSMQRDTVNFGCVRGWMVMRTTYDSEAPQGENPIRVMPVDPRNIYVDVGTRGIRRVIHKYEAMIPEILDDFPESNELFADREDDEQPVDVIAYYDPWYHAVVVDEREVKPATPHGYGFLPFSIRIHGGSPIRPTKSSDNGGVENIGPSIFEGAKIAYRQVNRVLSQLANAIADAADPALVVFHNPERREEPEELETSPGAVNYLWTDERVDPIRKSPNPADVNPLLQILMKDLEQATIPDVLWGAGSDQSGFAIALLSGAAKDATYGLIRALEELYEDVNEKALRLLRDVHQGEVGIVVQDRRGNWIGGETFSSDDIAAVGVRTKVKFRDITPKDQMQMSQMALALVKEKLISMETAREEFLKLENPDRENDRVLNSLIYQDPEIMKELLVPYSLYRNDPELFEVWASLMVNKLWNKIQEEQEQAQQAAMMGSIPGAAGMPPMPGVPPGMTPAPMGPMPFDGQQHAAASSAGGMGIPRQPGMPQAPLPARPPI